MSHEDFVATLESFKELKSGISGSRIKKLTNYALENVNDEQDLIRHVISYSKSCPNTHKLGSLYIIDSIGRAFLSKCNDSSHHLKSSFPEGTFEHAIFTLNQHIQTLLDDAIEKSSPDNKEKIKDLINIWDKSDLFQKSILNATRGKWFSLNIRPQELNKNPRERAIQILSGLNQMDNVPQVVIPQDLCSSDTYMQEAALFQLLSCLQSQLMQQLQTSNTSVESYPQVDRSEPTHYVGRSARSDKRGSHQEKRQRSRSPKRNSKMDDKKIQGNNHHLYPNEKNVTSNPHFRPKPISFDSSLPPNHVKVYSRTLFVGGVPSNMREHDIAKLLRQYGEVQSVILNNSRKHAFVKVYSRQEAENVLTNFNRDESSPLRIRWAVGFGPRDCCDYQHGYSIIPMHRLTEVDRKWSLSAEWGGTGGEQLQPNIVFEEPDIVVGEGVSSKAISQKMPTDSNRNGPKSGKPLPGPNDNSYDSPPNPYYGQLSGVDMMSNNTPYPQQMYQAPSHPQVMYQTPPIIQQTAQPGTSSFDPTAQLNSLMNMLNQQQN